MSAYLVPAPGDTAMGNPKSPALPSLHPNGSQGGDMGYLRGSTGPGTEEKSNAGKQVSVGGGKVASSSWCPGRPCSLRNYLEGECPRAPPPSLPAATTQCPLPPSPPAAWGSHVGRAQG